MEVVYVVCAVVYNGGHGSWPAVVQVTTDSIEAVEAARSIESLGYNIGDREANILVERKTVGETYSRASYKGPGNTIVFNRRIGIPKGFISEYVWEKELAQQLGLPVAKDWYEPSAKLPYQDSAPSQAEEQPDHSLPIHLL